MTRRNDGKRNVNRCMRWPSHQQTSRNYSMRKSQTYIVSQPRLSVFGSGQAILCIFPTTACENKDSVPGDCIVLILLPFSCLQGAMQNQLCCKYRSRDPSLLYGNNTPFIAGHSIPFGVFSVPGEVKQNDYDLLIIVDLDLVLESCFELNRLPIQDQRMTLDSSK